MKKVILILVLAFATQFAFSQTYQELGTKDGITIYGKWVKQDPYSNAENNYQVAIRLVNITSTDKDVTLEIKFANESKRQNKGTERVNGESDLDGWNGFSAAPKNGKTQEYTVYIIVKDK